MPVEWTTELEDAFLNAVLPAENDMFYWREICIFWRGHNLGSRSNEGDQYLRRRSLRRSDYTGPVSVLSRLYRAGKPWTWTERRVLDWAKHQETSVETRKEVTPEYLANLLQRTPEEIVAEYYRQVNTRCGGIQSFF
jgi:hypothetical protein